MEKKTIRQYLVELAVGEFLVTKVSDAPAIFTQQLQPNRLKRVRRMLKHERGMVFEVKKLENIGRILIMRKQ